MNLATLVSSLVLAASTATAGLLVAPSLPDLPASPQGGDGPTFGIGGDGWCIGACGNETAPDGNETADGDEASPPPPPQDDQSPPSDEEGMEDAAPDETCGVEIDDSRDIEGPTSVSWSWAVGAGTRNLTVMLDVSGAWTPLGGGAQVALTDGDGNVVAASDSASASGLPFGYTTISYAGDAATGLSQGVWHLTLEADGYLGGAWLRVRSTC